MLNSVKKFGSVRIISYLCIVKVKQLNTSKIMQDISKVINENRQEAYDLIKQAGGRIDFVTDIIKNDPDDDSQDDWKGNPNEHSLPWVVTGYDEGLIDTAVVAVKCGKKEGQIEFLAFDVESYECYGWVSYAECCSNTENEVYMFIDEFVNKKK